jgi:uncharacterized membrane protein YsdA (DUF1294 family)
MLLIAGAALLAFSINGAAFLLFMLDKHFAKEGMRRISESTLLLVALIGGSAGAIAGQHYWRHKTQKEPFRTTLYVIAAFHVGFMGWLLIARFIARA